MRFARRLSEKLKSNFSTFKLLNFSTCIMAAALSAQAVTLELLTNGKGTTLDGWMNAYSDSGSAFGIQTIGDVSWFASSHNTCKLSQTVTLADYGFAESHIQAHPTVTASGIFLAESGSSVCNVTVYELGASGNEIASHVIMDRPDETISSATAFSNTFSLNSSTRKLKYELSGNDSKEWAGYYGPKFRNCSLTISVGVQLWENGPVWAECNIGASNPEDYGYYFWWGDTIGYKRENNAWVASDGSTGNFSFTDGNAFTYGKNSEALLSAGYIDSTGNLALAHDAATAHLGFPWRMPTHADFVALLENCTSTWITTNGVSGRLFTGKGSYTDKSIFLPAAGETYQTTLSSGNYYGYYWSSSPYSSSNTADSRTLDFGEAYFDTRVRSRYLGWSVRPIIAPVSFTFVSDGSTIDTISYQIGDETTVTVPTASRDGNYAFLGYFTAESGGVQIFDENYEFVKETLPSLSWENTLYAHWLRLSTITFVSDGNTVSNVLAQQGNPFPTAPEATKTDYRFLGYFTAATGGTKVYNADRTPVQSVWDSTADVTYYAQWEPVSVPFVVTLVSDGSTIGPINARQGSPIDSVSVPTKAHGRFLGYWTESTGGDKVFNADGTPVDGTWTRYEDWTLYAQWEETHTFTFVSTDATVGTAVYAEGDTMAAPAASRAGDYIFFGYYTQDGEKVFDENCALVEGVLSGLPSDVTLYARWGVPEGSIAKLVYRGQLNLLTGDPAVHSGTYTKKMHFRVYDSSESTTPLWTTGEGGIDVTVNKDGSFVQVFGDDTLAELLATGTVTHVGLAIGESAVELKPRRELRPVAAVNHALTAEGAALDTRIGNLVTDNALVAADATVSRLEVTGRVTAPGAGEVAVSPLTVGDRERTRLMRGAGVKTFSAAKPTVLVADTGAKLRGEVLVAAPSDGIALITSKAGGERALRCPAVVQYCRAGESVRAPTSEAGGLKVTFFPFIGKEGR